MHSLVGMLFFLMVAYGDDNVRSYVKGFVGGDVFLLCNCSDTDSKFRWQADERVVVVEHTGKISNFHEDYKDRAELSEDSSNCSLLLKNITLEDKGEYRCSFKAEGSRYSYSHVHLTVILPAPVVGTSPGPKEPTSRANIQTLWPVIPVALVAVLSLFLFLFYKRKVSGRLNAGEEERALRIPV